MVADDILSPFLRRPAWLFPICASCLCFPILLYVYVLDQKNDCKVLAAPFTQRNQVTSQAAGKILLPENPSIEFLLSQLSKGPQCATVSEVSQTDSEHPRTLITCLSLAPPLASEYISSSQSPSFISPSPSISMYKEASTRSIKSHCGSVETSSLTQLDIKAALCNWQHAHIFFWSPCIIGFK